MLSTNHCDELNGLLSLGLVDGSMWRKVNLELNIPYFLIDSRLRAEGLWAEHTALLWRMDDVLEYINETKYNKFAQVTQITMLAPSGIGRTTGWELSGINEIWSGIIPTENRHVVLYVTHNGTHYGDSSCQTEISSLRDLQLLYSQSPKEPCSNVSFSEKANAEC
jgi:hypothetical protein